MYLTIFLLLSVGCESEAAGRQAPLKHNSSFQAIAGGWRRTDKGWENTALWVEKSASPQPAATARDQPSPQAAAYVNFIAQLHPGLIAGVQLLAAVCLLRDRSSPNRRACALPLKNVSGTARAVRYVPQNSNLDKAPAAPSA